VVDEFIFEELGKIFEMNMTRQIYELQSRGI